MTTTRAKAKPRPAESDPVDEIRESVADELSVDDADTDDLFDELDQADDLLDEVEEDDSEGWVPEEPGEGISGVLTKIGRTKSDFEEDPDKAMVPTWTIKTKDGTKWRVIGYGAVLRREMQDAEETGLEIGHLVAIKFFGEKLIKKGRFAGKPYKHYGVAHRAPRTD
jgi:hypothetical protein